MCIETNVSDIEGTAQLNPLKKAVKKIGELNGRLA